MRWIILVLCFALSLHSHAQKGYEKEWKEVTALQKKGLPQSVSALCEEIYQKAAKEKDFPQQLRAFLTRMDARVGIDRDSFYTDFRVLQEWKAQTPDSLQQSVLSQVILDKLTGYAEMNGYAIRQRSETAQTTDEDLRKWSNRQFHDQCLKLMDEATLHPKLLAHTSTEPFKGTIILGDASRYFLHDMLHLAGLHNVKILERLRDTGIITYQEATTKSKSIYSALREYYTRQGNRSGSLLLSLNLLQQEKEQQEIPDSVYQQQLSRLIAENRDLDVCVEVYLQKATSLRDEGKRTEALTLIDEALDRYFRYDRAGALRQLRKEILNPVLNVQIPRVAYPGERIKMQVRHRNLKGFTLRLYSIPMSANDTRLNKYTEKQFLKQYGGKATDLRFTLLPPKDYNERDTTFQIDAPSQGIYIAEVVADVDTPDRERLLLHVSSLKALLRNQQKGQTEIAVVDRKSGYPVAGVNLLLYTNQKGEFVPGETLTTNTDGRCHIPPSANSTRIFVQYGKDKALPELYAYNYGHSFQSGDTPKEQIKLLTDRGLYRPGQTVYVKGIAYRQLDDSTSVISGQEFTLTLFDANRQEVARTTLRSNDFGSFTHAFTLPTQTLNGNFQIRCGDFSTSIRVEEYKRPSFEIVIDTLQSAPQLGDSVTLAGKAFTFNGFPLQNDSVSYTITREPRYLRRMMSIAPQPVTAGSTRTDAQGEFQIPFRLVKPEPYTRNEEQSYRFRIRVDITDTAGETQRGESSLIAGNRSLILSCDLPKEICRDSTRQTVFRAENLNGTPITVQGRAELLTKNSKKVVWSTSFEANKEIMLSDWRVLSSGEYLLKLSANDAQGRPCKWEQEMILFSMNDIRPPVDTALWSKQFQRTFPANGNAEILFATNQKKAYVMYDLFTEGKLLESKHMILNDTLIHINLSYKEEYGEGVMLDLYFVKDGELYQETFTIQKPLPRKELALKWDVFRDRLQPGQKEEWRLTILKPGGQPAEAELMASMYDASLDLLYPFHPSFRVNYTRKIPQYSWYGGNEFAPLAVIEFPFKSYTYPDFVYDRWSFLTYYQARPMFGSMAGGMARRNSKSIIVADAENFSTQGMPAFDTAAKTESAQVAADESVTNEKGDTGDYLEPNAYVRQNFNETAFFYPQLYTNEKGEVSLSFTLPETLTKWKFTGIAQTKDVMTGMLQSDITTSKPFMLTTNLPRYLRQGDLTDLAGLIRNYSGETVNGTVKCEIFDPQTNKILTQFRKPFRIASDSTLAVSFTLDPLKNVEFVGIRMIADGGTFSDGEQHLLAVLSDKSHLVESIPLTLRGSGSKSYSLEPLFNHHSPTATDRKITVEMTVNPTWLAVQALPYLNTQSDDNALSYATAYYANTLSEWIVNQNPTLKQALEAWRTSGAPAESNLQRNSELKELLLQETPWVMEAQNEAERRARLVTLTETNTLNYQRSTALRKLQELQLANGAFPWFRGMMPSTSTTSFVLETLGRLTVLTNEKESDLSQSISKRAYSYLHKEMTQAYERITKKNAYKLSEQDLNYLYLCTLTREEVPASAKKAYEFYLSALRPSLTDLSLFGRATATLVLLHSGREAEAQDFYRSLKQYAVGNPETGLYFANVNPGLGDPTLTLTRALEAAQAMRDTTLVNEFKINLLRQKQTQVWNSTVSTANAVYALLKGEKSLTSGNGECSVTLGKQIIRCQPKAGDIDALMGYTKVSFTGKETQAKSATFAHTGNGICWGAVYGECMEQLNRIQMQGVSVQIEKEFFVKRIQSGKILWEKITGNTRLQKGDQLMTRLTVTTDRNMDFVTLKDQRAACLEPVEQLSGYRTGGYYLAQEDASSILFFDQLGKGTHVFEIENYVALSGTYHTGIAQLQSAYATEFSGHSASSTLVVE